MEAGLHDIPAFNVVGIGITMTNEEGRAAIEINKLWQRFYNESIVDKIPGKIGSEVYAVYWGYEGDHTKPYRLTIGCRTDMKDIPAGLEKVIVPNSKCAAFAARGQQPDALIKTWETIWTSDLQRSFTADYEIYGPNFFKPDMHEVLVYVGIK